MKEYIPPEHLKGRDDYKTAANPSLNCPSHIVNSGSTWFCTACGVDGYAQYEHGYKDMVVFISTHKGCKAFLNGIEKVEKDATWEEKFKHLFPVDCS
jgi:hypothetical protein